MRLDRIFHVAVFVPPSHVDAVIDAICRVTPLTYGPYEKSAWWSAVGTEQFEPTADASPTVGTFGKTERVETVRLEFVIAADQLLLETILSEAVFKAHPWQTPAVIITEARMALR